MTERTSHRHWLDAAAKASFDGRCLVDGELRASIDGETFTDFSPRDGALLTEVAFGSAKDVDAAVGSARAAFDDGRWSGLAPRKRKSVLLAFARTIRDNAEELALIETLDVGKPVSQSLSVDVAGAANCIEFYAEAADKLMGEVAPLGPDLLATVTREPVGVVGCVLPWNYPMLIASWKLGPALVAGNSVVVKPAEQSPLSAIRLAQLALEAGLPAGVFNVVPGDGPTTGAALGRQPGVDKIAFTGSTDIGRLFLTYSAESNLKLVSLECGGKSPHVVLADCPDLDAAASAVAWGIFYNQGESCSAGSRLLVDRAVKDELVSKVVEVGRAMRLGDPLDPATEVGAIIDRNQLEQICGFVERALSGGAELRLGGSTVLGETGGHYYANTVLDSVGADSEVARSEVFGPVLTVQEFEGPDQGLALANDSDYGLAAAVWTADLSTAHRFARALRAGTVWVNTYDAADVALPFGGYKLSGIGRDKSLHAIDGYTELKSTVIDLTH